MFPVDVPKLFKNSFLMQHLRWLLLKVLSRSSKVSRGLFFDFAPPRAFDFDQKLSQNAAQIILYYQVTKQFVACINWLVTCIWFQTMFWKTLIAFDFDEILTQSVAQVTVISRVKILSSLALCGWSGAFNFRVWFGKRKNAV